MTSPLTAEALATIDRCHESHAVAARIPGMAWGVVRGGALVHAGGAGTTDVDGGHTPGPHTLFRIASMTKSFTAAAVLSLRDEGRLRLDDPVAAFRWIGRDRDVDVTIAWLDGSAVVRVLTLSLPTLGGV